MIGYDSSTQVHARAKELGFCDHVANTPAEAAKDAELVLIAVPVGATADAVKSVAPHLREGAILTEVRGEVTDDDGNPVMTTVVTILGEAEHEGEADEVTAQIAAARDAAIAKMVAGQNA